MIRILHLADLHLGWDAKYLPDYKRKIRNAERDTLLRKAADAALDPQNSIDAVIIAGDLFEKYDPDENLERESIRQLQRIADAGKMLVTVPGNHDEITYKNSVYRNHSSDWPGELVTNPMPEHCFTRMVKGISVHIYSLAYTGGLTNPASIDAFPGLAGAAATEAGVANSAAAGVSGGTSADDGAAGTAGHVVQRHHIHIGVFHGSLDWEAQADRSLPLSSAKLAAAGYDYVALGHIHRFDVKSTGTGAAKLVYPGAPEFKSFSDPGTGSFVIAQLDESGGEVRIEKIPANVRAHEEVTLDISETEDYAGLKQLCLEHAGREKILRIILEGTPRFGFDHERLRDELEQECFYIEIENETSYFSGHYVEMVSREATVRGIFVKRMKERIAAAEGEYERKVLEQALLRGLKALERSEA
ncbi:MAG: DNA repair exonuclease [Eubacteriales bacterium]|nr:DNA repair exonuclease [Eubacteriales bacterium]